MARNDATERCSMSTVPTTNAEVISLFRRNAGNVPSPFEDDPPPMIITHTIGARSGKKHLVPLRAIPTEDDAAGGRSSVVSHQSSVGSDFPWLLPREDTEALGYDR
jgi:hypothetical protein